MTNPNYGRKVPTFEGRLFTDSERHGLAGNWVRRAEVDALLDEIAMLRRRLETRELNDLVQQHCSAEPPVQLLKDFEITPEMEAEMMRPGKFELVFPQQRMEPDTSPLTHQEIFSAVHHHAAEIVRLTAAVPAQCSEPASNVMIVNHFPEETRVAPSLACRYCPARFMTAWEHEVHEKEHAVKSRVSE